VCENRINEIKQDKTAGRKSDRPDIVISKHHKCQTGLQLSLPKARCVAILLAWWSISFEHYVFTRTSVEETDTGCDGVEQVADTERHLILRDFSIIFI